MRGREDEQVRGGRGGRGTHLPGMCEKSLRKTVALCSWSRTAGIASSAIRHSESAPRCGTCEHEEQRREGGGAEVRIRRRRRGGGGGEQEEEREPAAPAAAAGRSS